MKKILLIVCSLFFAAHGYASWNTLPNVNTPVVTAANDQTQQSIASDGKGGIIIAWQDSRGTNPDIYAQRIDAWGNVKWQSNGIPICTAADVQFSPVVVADNKGGAYIVWLDARNSGSGIGGSNDTDVYINHVDSLGNLTWTQLKGYNNGMPVAVYAVEKDNLRALADGMGGVFIAWNDYRVTLGDTDSVWCSQPTYNLKHVVTGCAKYSSKEVPSATVSSNSLPRIDLQHVNISDTMWTNDSTSIPTCDTAHKYPQKFPNLVSDGSGGVFVIWEDVQPTATQILCQYFNDKGTMQYAHAGDLVCAQLAIKNNLVAASDNNGGFVAAWEDKRNASNTGTDIYAQRIMPNGSQAWTTLGVPIVQYPQSQTVPQITCDNTGDAYVVWQDSRNQYTAPNYFGTDLYGQLLNVSDGSPLWANNGAALVVAPQDQLQQQVALDDSGGIYLVWQDNHANTGATESDYSNAHIYAKHIRSDSTTVWGGATGIPVCTAANEQSMPIMITANNSITVVWHDERNLNTSAGDLYAQWALPPGDSAITLPASSLNFGGVVPGDTAFQPFTLNNTVISSGVTIDSIKSTDPHFYYKKPLRSPVLSIGGSVIVTIGFAPTGTASYSTNLLIYDNMESAPDTVIVSGNGSGGPYLQTDSNTVNFGTVQSGILDTNILQIHNSGNSPLTVSSLAMTKGVFQYSPAIPPSKVIPPGDSIAISIIFAPNGANMYSDTMYIASNSATSPDMIIFSGTGVVTDVEEVPATSSYSLAQNFPNPFRVSTTLRFTLPATEQAQLSIVDMLGRQISMLADGVYPQGSHDAVFDGSNLPNGVYTCVLQTRSSRISRNIVLVH